MTDRNPTVVVTSDETLPGIIERLRSAASGGRTVNLVIPIDSPLLLTASEFRALKDAIDADRLAVIMRSSDPLRLQLAERLGIRVQALPRPRATVAAVASPPVRVPEIIVAPPTSNGDNPDADLGVTAIPRPDPSSHWPSLSEPAVSASGDERGEDLPLDDVETVSDNPPRRWLPVAAALAVLVVGAFLAIRYLLPQAVVSIVPKSAPVSVAVRFDVTSDGQPLEDGAAFVVTPQQRQIEVVWTGSMPTSGVRVVPDGTAEGPIELRNTSPEPLTVDAGTEVATETDVAFRFTDAVTVPAADAATGEPGAATGAVAAVQAGSGGNVGTGELGGRLPNGVYYSNRMQPTAGGTDKEFPVVAQEDLDALTAAARQAAPELAAAALAAEDAGADVIASTVTVAAQQDAFDHEAGAEAESVALRATLTLELKTYDGQAASEQLEPAVVSRLNDEAPDGFAVTPEQIAYDPPATVKESERGVRLEVAARAVAEAILDDAERESLIADLAGAGPEEAEAILAQRPEIAEFTIAYHPAWLPQQMPANTGGIQLEISQ